ncbi:hypothetical protein AGDE_09931 [Angomonas deanei]|nr:hypothetical protein AGDE_09931 [Angomonas deanei]|eukprot:EPY29487.1 hypothetical protein AGDE_09931 [Angomonas deanei]
MSMQVDFEYPRQVEDMNILKSAIGGFEKNMNRMMLLMKEVGTALEKVSHSYQQLTSLSFSKNAQVRNRVNHFMEEVTAMQEGAPFKEYNTKVHDEVLAPVQGLKTALKEAQKQQQLREKRYKEYQKAKDKVDKTEKTHAKKSKPLETSAKYPLQKKDREQRLENFRAQDVNFQTAFNEMVERMEGVSQETMTCYLHLNANYFASIIDCLTKTDPTVVEVVEQYRLTMKRERQRSIQEEIGRLRAEEHASQTASPHKESELLQNSGHLSGSYSSVRRLPYDTASPAARTPHGGTRRNRSHHSLNSQCGVTE